MKINRSQLQGDSIKDEITIVEAKKKKEWNPNPFAVCHTTVDKDKDPEKFERCVLEVKKKQKKAFNLKEHLEKLASQESLENWNDEDEVEIDYVEAANESNIDVEAKKKKKKDGWPKKVKKGRFTSYCKKNGFKGACIECAKKALKSDDASVRGMATFYMNTVKPKGKTSSDI